MLDVQPPVSLHAFYFLYASRVMHYEHHDDIPDL
jgi:hypothetical protein